MKKISLVGCAGLLFINSAWPCASYVVPCTANYACTTSCITATVPNSVALYNGQAGVYVPGDLSNQTITFNQGAAIPPNPEDDLTVMFPLTIGTLDPNGSVEITTTNTGGGSGTTFNMKTSTGPVQTLPYTIDYQDCNPASNLHHLTLGGAAVSVPSAGSSIVAGVGTVPPCHPSQEGNVAPGIAGNGAGQLIFTLPKPATGSSFASGIYTDTVTLYLVPL